MRKLTRHQQIAAVALTLSGAGAIGGIPALVGLVWSRRAVTP